MFKKGSTKINLFFIRPFPPAFLLFLTFLPIMAFSGEFRVVPIRLTLNRENKTGVITVINEGTEKLHVQMNAFEWTQDAEGKDNYTETSDIIFFPKIMIIEKNEERLIRAGIKIPAIKTEKTYRLFIEEIPRPQDSEGVNVAIKIRFGVPIFVKPLKELTICEIEKVGLKEGVISVIVKNTGNSHFLIKSLMFKGKNLVGEEVFSKDLNGWYLLNGVSRFHSTQIPQEICKDLARIDVEVKTDIFKVNSGLDVNQGMCLF